VDWAVGLIDVESIERGVLGNPASSFAGVHAVHREVRREPKPWAHGQAVSA
jgi:hypothetical protein